MLLQQLLQQLMPLGLQRLLLTGLFNNYGCSR